MLLAYLVTINMYIIPKTYSWAQAMQITEVLHCPGDPEELLGSTSEALAFSLLSINEAINCVTVACFNKSSSKISLYSIWRFLMLFWVYAFTL